MPRSKPVFEAEGNNDDETDSPPSSRSMAERKLALFIDFENIAIGVTDA